MLVAERWVRAWFVAGKSDIQAIATPGLFVLDEWSQAFSAKQLFVDDF